MSETEILTLFVFAYPFLVVAMALGVVWITGRLDQRERQRPAAE